MRRQPEVGHALFGRLQLRRSRHGDVRLALTHGQLAIGSEHDDIKPPLHELVAHGNILRRADTTTGHAPNRAPFQIHFEIPVQLKLLWRRADGTHLHAVGHKREPRRAQVVVKSAKLLARPAGLSWIPFFQQIMVLGDNFDRLGRLDGYGCRRACRSQGYLHLPIANEFQFRRCSKTKRTGCQQKQRERCRGLLRWAAHSSVQLSRS